MASNNEEDTDLDALRSAVLATLKTRGRNDSSSCVTTEDEGSRNDNELEELRKAALQSKKLLDNENKLQTSFWQARFPVMSDFRRNIDFLKGFNRNGNLIVIKPVEESEVYATNSQPDVRSQSSGENGELDRHSQQPRRMKSSGKFSRFESDSENSEDNSDDDESQPSIDTSSDEEDHSDPHDDDDASQETIEDNVLLLHPDDDLQDTIVQDDALTQHTSLQSSKNKSTAACADKEHETKRGGESNCDSSHASGSSRRSIERAQHHDHYRRNVKENSDRRDRSDRTSKRGENDERQSGDLKQDDSRKASHRVRHEGKHGDDPKEERRSKRRDSDKSRKARDKRRRSLVARRRFRERKQTTESLVKDACKAILRSRNASPTKTATTTIDLREKLRLKKEHKDSKMEPCDNGGREGGHSSPMLRSVLSVVAPTPTLTLCAPGNECKSKSRSPLPPNRGDKRTVPAPRAAVRRKSESPGRLEVISQKTRKVLILSEKERKATTTKDANRRVVDEIECSRETALPVQRIPVRERLGIPPNNAKSSSSSSSSPKAVRHSKSASMQKSKSPPNRVQHQRRASPATLIHADGATGNDDRGEEPKRRVKLHRGTFASLIVSHPPSTSIKLQHQELPSGGGDKIGRHKGLPTFENELDDRIRRIQVNNEAILKRKYEISCDRHRHK